MVNNLSFIVSEGIWASRFFKSSFSFGTVQSAIAQISSIGIDDENAKLLICSSLITLDFARISC